MAKKISNSEKRQKEQKKEYKAICRMLNINRVRAKYGLKKILWAMNRFVTTERETARLIKEKTALEEKLEELSKKL